MSLIKKPMLAEKAGDLNDLEFPAYASYKLDGIRCLIVSDPKSPTGKSAVSRNLKLIPNRFVQNWLRQYGVVGMDGELLIRDGANQTADFSAVTSGIMSDDGEPDFYYAVFDFVDESLAKPFVFRYASLAAVVGTMPARIQLLPQKIVSSSAELQSFYEKALLKGFEGAMYRKINSPYKCGRSSVREAYLLKIKPFDPDEAEIIGFNQGETNLNDPKIDLLGHTKRSTSKEGKLLVESLGSFKCRDIKTKIEFDCGTGLTQSQREEIWANRQSYLGKIIRYKHQGMQDKPRFPVFLGFRDRRDM